MKNYDPTIRMGTHTIKVSFQRWDYKGFVTFRRGGNCKGLSVLALDEEDLYYQPLTDNPIGFGVLPEDDEGNKWFKMTLTNDEGDELLVEDVWEELGDYIVGLEIIRLVKDHEHLKRIISERRIVYEAKDLNSHAKGRKFFVPDFRVRFRDKNRLEINWSFEIELTMKTRRRYRSSIFPKYIKELEKNKNAHVIYVTPSGAIREELEAFKRVFYQAETKKDARLGELFDRFHILSDKNFETELKYLLETDPGINWLPEKENNLYQDGSVQETLELFVEEKKGEEKEETEKEENKSSKSKMKFNPEAF